MGRKTVLISTFTFIFILIGYRYGLLPPVRGGFALLIFFLPLIVLAISFHQVMKTGNPVWE